MPDDVVDTDEDFEPDSPPDTPAANWERDNAARALDELLRLTFQYKSGKDYHELMKFIARFRAYSPYNAMLIHTQKPGSRYAAPAGRWLDKWPRTIKFGARPLVILQPMGPVMFVFDVSDTEPLHGAPPLPKDIDRPFDVRSGQIGREFESLVENAKRDGIRVHEVDHGSQSAGLVQLTSKTRESQRVFDRQLPDGTLTYIQVPVRYELAINGSMTLEAKYVTLAHELGHLYCGHLGTPNPKWWPDRRGLKHSVEEFEAESAAYLVCGRLGIDNPSEEYLAGYARREENVPPISLECVMRSAGLIETMSRRRRMKPRKSDP